MPALNISALTRAKKKKAFEYDKSKWHLVGYQATFPSVAGCDIGADISCQQERSAHANVSMAYYLPFLLILFIWTQCSSSYLLPLQGKFAQWNRYTKQTCIYICSYHGWYRWLHAITAEKSFSAHWLNIGHGPKGSLLINTLTEFTAKQRGNKKVNSNQ